MTSASDRSGDSTIDANILSSDVTGTCRHQECDDLGNLIGGSVTLQRNTLLERLLLRQAVYETGQDVIHADIVCRILVREQLGERGQPGAEHARCRKCRFRLKCSVRRYVDDHATALSLHDGRNESTCPDHVQQVHIQTTMPVVIGEFEHRTFGPVPGTVDKHIYAAPFVHGRINNLLKVVD